MRSAIDEVASTDLSLISDEDLAEDAIEVSRAVDILTHRLAGIADEAHRRGSFRRAGYLNVTRWLAHITDIDNSTARRLVGIGKTLASNGDTSRLASNGDLSRTRVRVLSRAAKAHPDHYEQHEKMLLEFGHLPHGQRLQEGGRLLVQLRR